ncbi:MAG: spore coat protein CotJB [Mycoplasmatota bacterium]
MNNYNMYRLQNINEPYPGFIKGNMFENLYKPYKFYKPAEITPNSEQGDWLLAIDCLSFACHDLNLFLDLHNDDFEARQLFNKYNNDLKTYTKYYEDKYGPIYVNNDSILENNWAWVKSPWPWEN